jgi:hypothetical protein
MFGWPEVGFEDIAVDLLQARLSVLILFDLLNLFLDE